MIGFYTKTELNPPITSHKWFDDYLWKIQQAKKDYFKLLSAWPTYGSKVEWSMKEILQLKKELTFLLDNTSEILKEFPLPEFPNDEEMDFFGEEVEGETIYFDEKLFKKWLQNFIDLCDLAIKNKENLIIVGD
jgi:hypothetical protein